jgi:hypothetical protein
MKASERRDKELFLNESMQEVILLRGGQWQTGGSKCDEGEQRKVKRD